MNFQAGPCDKNYSYPIDAAMIVKDGRVLGDAELGRASAGPAGRGVTTKAELMEAERQGSDTASISVVFYNGEPLDFTALDGGAGGLVPQEMLVSPTPPSLNTHARICAHDRHEGYMYERGL